MAVKRRPYGRRKFNLERREGEKVGAETVQHTTHLRCNEYIRVSYKLSPNEVRSLNRKEQRPPLRLSGGIRCAIAGSFVSAS